MAMVFDAVAVVGSAYKFLFKWILWMLCYGIKNRNAEKKIMGIYCIWVIMSYYFLKVKGVERNQRSNELKGEISFFSW